MAELVIPLLALGGLYFVSKQKDKEPTSVDGFTPLNDALPNTDLPNRNYPEEYPIVSTETDQTTKLATVNKYDSNGVYTDKYFNPNMISAMDVPSGISLNSKTPAENQTQYYSLTGDKVSSSYFQHNNMVPFFGSNVRSMLVDENSNESVLDNLVGTGSQIYVKKEQAPLFSPATNLQWANGAPNTTDFYKSRMNVSNKMSNVKPFLEERVAPGLGGQGSHGFNSGMMARDQWLPKTADELRVATNPKISHMLVGHEGPAMSHVVNTGILGKMEKNRPDQAFDMGPERYMTTTGASKGPTLQAIPIDRYVNRPTTTTTYTGAAGSSNTSVYTDGEYMPSKHMDLGEVPFAPASATGRSGAREGDYGIRAKNAYPNNRTTTNQNDYFGAIGGAFGAAVAPLLDVLRPSRKENTIGTLRPYQNPAAEVKQGYLFNPADRPGTTIRESTENAKMHWNINSGQNGGAYKVTAHQPTDTARRTTGDFYYAGNAGGGEGTKRQRTYQAEYNQRNNEVKSSTIEGRLVPGGMALLNGDIHQRNKSMDTVLRNQRAVAPSMPAQAPDAVNIGKLQGTNNRLYDKIQMDRTNPDVMSALQTNPYTLSVLNGL
jgi:hypothetical protein